MVTCSTAFTVPLILQVMKIIYPDNLSILIDAVTIYGCCFLDFQNKMAKAIHCKVFFSQIKSLMSTIIWLLILSPHPLKTSPSAKYCTYDTGPLPQSEECCNVK